MAHFPAVAGARGMLAVAVACATLGCVDPSTEHRVRANAYLRGGDAAAALAECDRGLERKPKDLPLLILRGKALFELDRIDDARAAYQLALDLGKDRDPRDLAEAQLGAAMAASRSKDWAGARKHFEALVAINDRDATSMLNVARACLEQGDLPCAVDHGERAGRLRGNDEVVQPTEGPAVKLHLYWDGLLGDRATPAEAIAAAKELPAADPELAAVSDPALWIIESFTIAQNDVYTDLIGEDAGRIGREIDGEHCGDLATAVARARTAARRGDVVLLSPACASWDQFEDFEARGRAFRELVRSPTGTPPPPEV